jgi:diguanylate cyclase (GGDEF)-like protein
VLRANDILARFGGDEFALLLPDCDGEHAARIAERLRRSTPNTQGASIGVAQWNRREDAEALMNRADVALYQAKDQGRNRVVSAG